MKFNGDFDKLMQNSKNFKLEIISSLVARYGLSHGLQKSQITAIGFSRGSVIITVVIKDDCDNTNSANVTRLLVQMEQDVSSVP